MLVVGFVFALGGAGAARAATVVNGGFETGDFTGWTKVDQVGGSGSWFVYAGIFPPLSGLPIAPPPEGTRAATTDQTGPGSHVLYQDVALEPGVRHTLNFTLYYANRALAFANPATLAYTVSPNQQYRVDIMNPSAPVTSVAAGDVLASVFQTRPGDPLTLAPTAMTSDLSSFAGQTVRIRFAEVDNQGFFQGSVDAVRIASQAPPSGGAGGNAGRVIGNGGNGGDAGPCGGGGGGGGGVGAGGGGAGGGGCFDVQPVQSLASGRIRAFAKVATRGTTVRAAAYAEKRRGAKHRARVGRSTRRKLTAGRHKITVRLSSKVRHRLKRRGRAKFKLRLRMTAPTGKPLVVTRTVTLVRYRGYRLSARRGG